MELTLLRGLRVLERSDDLGGAYAGMVLGQLGAEVSRVPTGSDRVDPLVREATDAWKVVLGGEPEVSAALAAADVVVSDAGRWGAAVDSGAAAAEGAGPVELLLDLAEPEHLAMSGRIDWEGVSAVSGVSVVLGQPHREPLSLPADLTAEVTAVNGVAALLAALLVDPADRPRVVRVSAAGCLEEFVGMNGKMYEGYPRRWMREGRRAAGSSGPYPAAFFRCSDGYVLVLARSSEDWAAILAAMGDPAWADRPGYRDPLEVSQHHADEVDEYVDAWIRDKTARDVTRLGNQFGFATAPVSSIAEALANPQLAARRSLRELEVGGERVQVPTLPIVLPEVEVPEPRRGPSSDGERSWRPGGAGGSPAKFLSGLRVLDLSWVWSAPMVCMTLADLGADVIKVEHRRRPDGSRLRGRPSRDGVAVEGPILEVTPYFHQVNHGKRSVELDLSDPAEAEVIRDLAVSADVVVENMRPGVLARRGLGYEQLAELNPGLVMLSMSLAGQEGPLRDAKGYAAVMSAMSGLESLIGYDDELTGMLSFAVGDPNAAGHGLVAVLAALRARERDGRGCWIDLSQLEGLMFGLLGPVLRSQLGEPAAAADAAAGPSGMVACSGQDQWVHVSFEPAGSWERFSEAIGGEGAAPEERLTRWARSRTRPAVVSMLRATGALAAPVRSLEEVRATSGRRTLRIDHPYGPDEQVWIPPWHFDGRLPGTAVRAPLLGEHAEQLARSNGSTGTSRQLWGEGRHAGQDRSEDHDGYFG